MVRSWNMAAVALGMTSLAASRSVALDAPLPVTEKVLDNGLKVLVLEDRSIPNVALYVGWRVGSRNEVPGITGLAHFFEHMMFSGGARYGGSFDPIMEACGGANNAYTTNDVTVYQDWFPAAQLEQILDMEADRMRGMVFKDAVVETERGVVASERRLSMEDPAEVMREQMWATAYTAHSYQWSVLGHMVDIQGWRKDDLERFFATHYAPNNATLIIVGDVSPERVFALVQQKMGDIPRKPERRPIHTAEPPQRGERRVVVEDGNANLRQVMSAWHICATSHPDFPAIEVIERLLLHGESSRLWRALVDEERVCLDVSGGYQGYQFDPSLFSVEMTLREGQDPARAEEVLYGVLDGLARDGPTERELEKVKNSIVAATTRSLKTINGKASLLMDTELFFGGWQKLRSRVDDVAAVGSDDVKRVAGAYLTRRNRTVVTLEIPTDAAAIESPDSVGAGAGEEEEGDEEAAAPAAPPARPAVPAIARASGPAPVVKLPATIDFTLGNGLRVILVPDREVPLVSCVARVMGGGLEDPAGKEGAASLLAALLTKGAGERDARTFQETVDFVGGLFGAGANQRWIDVQGEMMSKDTDLLLELLADVLTRPKLDPVELDKERGLALDALAAAREEPPSIIGRYYGAFLFQGHAMARPSSGDERTLKTLTRDDVLAAAKRALAPSRTWLAVSGDFEPVEMRKKIEARLGGWQAAVSPIPALAPVPPAKGKRVLLVDKPGALQTYFMFGNLGFDWRDPDYAARYLANTILGGRFTSRLNQALRVESGLTYGARSWFDDSRRGLFAVSTYTATDTSEACLQLASDVYTRFLGTGITAAELESARSYIKGQYAPDTVETADQVAAMVLALDVDGVPRAVIDQFFANLDALTPEKVNAVVSGRFPKDLEWVVIGQADGLREIVARFGAVTEVPLAGPGFGPGF